MCKFFKDLSAKKPRKAKYSSIWDPDPVLKTLEKSDNSVISIKKLITKLVTLLALITTHRVQTLTKIKISNIIKNKII